MLVHTFWKIPLPVIQEDRAPFKGTAPELTQKSKHPPAGKKGDRINHMTVFLTVKVYTFTSALEDARVAVTVSLSESLHHSVNLLSFTRQTETPQELSAGGRSGLRTSKNEYSNQGRAEESRLIHCVMLPLSKMITMKVDFPQQGLFVFKIQTGHLEKNTTNRLLT